MSCEKSRSELNYEARVDLATSYRACDYYDLNLGIFNHLTQRAPARNREGDVMLVIPHGLLWSKVTASRLIGVDFDTGDVVEGEGEIAETANSIHRAIHKTRYPMDGTTSIMHTHQPYSTALACLDDPEPFKFALTQSSMLFSGKMAYDLDYSGMAHGEEEGYRLAKVIGSKSVLMMANHGVLTVGRRASDAFMLLYFLEKAAKVQVLAQSTGVPMRFAPSQTAKKLASFDMAPESLLFFKALIQEMTDQQPSVMN